MEIVFVALWLRPLSYSYRLEACAAVHCESISPTNFNLLFRDSGLTSYINCNPPEEWFYGLVVEVICIRLRIKCYGQGNRCIRVWSGQYVRIQERDGQRPTRWWQRDADRHTQGRFTGSGVCEQESRGRIRTARCDRAAALHTGSDSWRTVGKTGRNGIGRETRKEEWVEFLH